MVYLSEIDFENLTLLVVSGAKIPCHLDLEDKSTD